MQCPSYHPWSKQGPPCLLLLTKHKKTAPRQAQPLRSSNPRTNLAHRIQKKTYFSNTQNTSAKLSIIFFLLSAFLFKRHLPLSLHYPTQLCHCSGVPMAPHRLPAPQAQLHPSWLEQTSPQVSTFHHAAKANLPKGNSTTTPPAWLCCGQEPEPYHAPQPDGRAAPRQLLSSDLMWVKAALCSELLSDPELVSTLGFSSQHCSEDEM